MKTYKKMVMALMAKAMTAIKQYKIIERSQNMKRPLVVQKMFGNVKIINVTCC